jgi:hypothetical protein
VTRKIGGMDGKTPRSALGEDVCELQPFENMVVLTLNDDLSGIVATGAKRADAPKTWVDWLTKVRDDDQVSDGEGHGRPVGSSDRGLALDDLDDLAGLVTVLVAQNNPGPATDGVTGKLDTLGEVLLEHEAEAATGA